ncbi:hypothetical protein [Aeromicrobium chenweiae]|uniref:hypothetical protein n=1 Tax=Aeromicrobium chenweiae TaxID=2079793 RepID=UPI00109195ED|nr:hypothetical protein [Aeromicrobium chenweiae]TGN32565.1 hypothetical protein E4L97_07565 [Aeromicrobium chenweiae]
MDPDVEVAKLREKLRLCQLELAKARRQQEELAEASLSHDETEQRLVDLTRRLDGRLVQGESVTGPRGWLKRRVLSTMPSPDEDDDLAVLRSSALMDGPWYFQQYPEVASTGLSASLHYLRHGAGQGKDPGPEFVTATYREQHPEIADGVNPLVHFLRLASEPAR